MGFLFKIGENPLEGVEEHAAGPFSQVCCLCDSLCEDKDLQGFFSQAAVVLILRVDRLH